MQRTSWARWHHVKASSVLRAWCWAQQEPTEPLTPNSDHPVVAVCLSPGTFLWWNAEGRDETTKRWTQDPSRLSTPPLSCLPAVLMITGRAGAESGKEERSAKEGNKVLRRDVVLPSQNKAAGGNSSPPWHLLQGWGQLQRILENLKYFWTSEINFLLDNLA